jgi:hypothetical protein
MALKRDWRRVGATSATLSAGALVFFAAGTGPASADTRPAASSTQECKLGRLLCGILGGGSGTPASPPPTSSGGSTSTKPTAKPTAKTGGGTQPKPKPAAPARHSSGGGSTAVPPPAAGVPTIPVPNSAQTPALPDVTTQDPLVLPEPAPDGRTPTARLAAQSGPASDTVPPLLVATASGLVGALAALNLSVLRRRRQGT